jgi:iron-sulfur-dependent L-serine dehydratase beta subunit
MENFPSIFNDVIGPVMRGPSSSHCAASLRIGRLCRDLMQNNITSILVEFDPTGSLADTHTRQGSDMGLFGGFLGWEADGLGHMLGLDTHDMEDLGEEYVGYPETLQKSIQFGLKSLRLGRKI